MRRVTAKFLPKLLKFDQKQHRINIAEELLDSVRHDPNLLYGCDVETKAQSSRYATIEEIKTTSKMELNKITKNELFRRLLQNQHKFRHYLQKQIRLSSSGIPHTQEAHKFDENTLSVTNITSEILTNTAIPIEHDEDVGHLFSAADLSVRLAAPHELQPKPDLDGLVFGRQFSDHMLKVFHYSKLGGWQKPEITPMENLVLHPAAKVLHYAIELFEGTKAYRGEDGRIRLFRPDMNMRRMNLSAKRSGLPTFDGAEYIKCLCRLISIDQEWVPHSPTGSLYIRPTFIGIDPTLGVALPDSALLYTILSPVGSYFTANSKGSVALLADPRYTRAWPGGVGDRKMGSNYAPTLHVQKEAYRKGLQHVLWLYGEDEQLTEVGIMNIFMFFVNDNGERELITPALNGLILPGITRDSILTLAREWGEFKVSEGQFTMGMVRKLIKEERLLELFGAGTAAVISPIDRIHYLGEDILIPTMEQEKPVYERLKNMLNDIQYGRIKHPWGLVVE